MGKYSQFNPECERFEKAVGAIIRQRRHELGLSQPTLAEKMGVLPKVVRSMEGGLTHVNLAHLYKLCPLLKMSVTALIWEAEELVLSGAPLPTTPRRVSAKVPTPTFKGIPKLADVPGWLRGLRATDIGESHGTSSDQLRRRDRQRSSPAAAKLCEVDER